MAYNVPGVPDTPERRAAKRRGVREAASERSERSGNARVRRRGSWPLFTRSALQAGQVIAQLVDVHPHTPIALRAHDEAERIEHELEPRSRDLELTLNLLVHGVHVEHPSGRVCLQPLPSMLGWLAHDDPDHGHTCRVCIGKAHK